MNKTDMKSKIKALIVVLGITFDEIVVELQIDEYRFDSIEWDRDLDEIYLHTFERNLSIEYNLEAIEEEVQEQIYNHLLKLVVI